MNQEPKRPVSSHVLRILTFLFVSISQVALTLDEFIEYKPGGETLCARGTEFSFFVHEGSSNKVVIDFIGGGACWNEENCSKEGATFVDSTDLIREMYEKGLKGVYDYSNPENPLKDWTHIIVPYCTGDIHWGENDKIYTKENGETFTIHHREASNAKAVIKWAKEKYPNPDKVFVTGCSAGAYGSIYWTPHIVEKFPNSKVTQFGDSGVGVVTKEFLKTSYSIWKPELNAPTWIDELNPQNVDWVKLSLNDFYKATSRKYPNSPLSQFSYTDDENQKFFHELMGGDSRIWSSELQAKFKDLNENLENFSSFVIEGEDHCILPYNEFYTRQNDQGKNFKVWFEERL